MTALIQDLIDLYIFPRGRREFALRAMSELARDHGHADLASHCDEAADHDRRTRELERAGESAQAQGADPELASLDARIDRTLSALASVPEATARALGGQTRHEADAFLDAIFPQGVGAITGLPWAAQITEVKALIALMRGEQKGPVVRFHLDQLVDQLDELANQFDKRLGRADRTQVDRNELRARDAAGQDHLLEAVAMVLGLHPKATKADDRERVVLLKPMLLQVEQIRAARAQRRPPTDIDPSLGGPEEGDQA